MLLQSLERGQRSKRRYKEDDSEAGHDFTGGGKVTSVLRRELWDWERSPTAGHGREREL